MKNKKQIKPLLMESFPQLYQGMDDDKDSHGVTRSKYPSDPFLL